MQLRQLQSDDKTRFWVRLHDLANKYVLKREILGRALGIIQTGSQNQQNPNAPTFEERSVEWTLRSGRKRQGISFGYHTTTCTKFQVRILTINKGSSNRVPRAMLLQEGECIVDSGASLRMMSKSDLTPQEQETNHRSKDPSIIKTANTLTHTTEEATENVSDLDMFVKVQWLKESPAVLFVGQLVLRQTAIRTNDIQVTHHISSRMS